MKGPAYLDPRHFVVEAKALNPLYQYANIPFQLLENRYLLLWHNPCDRGSQWYVLKWPSSSVNYSINCINETRKGIITLLINCIYPFFSRYHRFFIFLILFSVLLNISKCCDRKFRRHRFWLITKLQKPSLHCKIKGGNRKLFLRVIRWHF